MTTRTIRAATTDRQSRVEGLNIRDSRGRCIGVHIETFTAEYTAAPETAYATYGYAPGTYYVAEVQVTRNGERYGACQRYAHFPTVAERDAYIAKRIADSRKRAAKLGAKA